MESSPCLHPCQELRLVDFWARLWPTLVIFQLHPESQKSCASSIWTSGFAVLLIFSVSGPGECHDWTHLVVELCRTDRFSAPGGLLEPRYDLFSFFGTILASCQAGAPPPCTCGWEACCPPDPRLAPPDPPSTPPIEQVASGWKR